MTALFRHNLEKNGSIWDSIGVTFKSEPNIGFDVFFAFIHNFIIALNYFLLLFTEYIA